MPENSNGDGSLKTSETLTVSKLDNLMDEALKTLKTLNPLGEVPGRLVEISQNITSMNANIVHMTSLLQNIIRMNEQELPKQ